MDVVLAHAVQSWNQALASALRDSNVSGSIFYLEHAV